ncbi:MAG: class E sortase [Acidimicrobiia bacterium]
MGLTRHSIRFTLAAVLVVALAGPAAAAPSRAGLEPGSARQPSTHRSQSAGWVFSNLRIPAIGVDEAVRAGVSLEVLDRGVGHWAGTARPGEAGNVVLAGHRSIHSRPFANLDALDPGDLVYVTDEAGAEVIYRVRETFIVDPTDLWITYDHATPTLTMFACHPKGSAAQRIVVVADLVSRQRIG